MTIVNTAKLVLIVRYTSIAAMYWWHIY